MKPKRTPLDSLPDERARQVLRGLHAEAGKEHMRLMRVFVPYLGRMLRGKPLPWERLEGRFDRFYMSTSPEAGVFTYLLARAIDARRIVEYGTSFGVSTIYLALAVRDNGGGLVYGTELVPAKADAARRNLARLPAWANMSRSSKATRSIRSRRSLDRSIL